jgi:apolipoprotein N-acyltransferase
LPARRRGTAWPLVLSVAVSASAFYASTGLDSFWPAAWIAPIPVLVLAARTDKWAAAVAAFGAYFLGSLNLFTYLTEVMPVPIALTVLVTPAVAFGGTVLVSHFATQHLTPWSAVFVFPAAWVYEFLL